VGDTLELEQGGLAMAKRPAEGHARLSGESEPQALYESALSAGPSVLTLEELRQLRKIQAEADRDPQAYMEACRRWAP
jgi:hypothetical protein